MHLYFQNAIVLRNLTKRNQFCKEWSRQHHHPQDGLALLRQWPTLRFQTLVTILVTTITDRVHYTGYDQWCYRKAQLLSHCDSSHLPMHSRVALNSSSSASHVTANSLQSKSKQPPRWTGTPEWRQTCWSASAKLCYTFNMNSPRFMQTPPTVPSQCFHRIKTKKQNNIDPEVRRSPLRLCLRWSLHIH